MNQMNCSMCQKTNQSSKKLILIAAFAQKFHAENVVYAMQKAHISPAWHNIFSKEEIVQKTRGRFLESETLILELHGIEDIVQLECLYIESMCRENYSLTVDVVSSQRARNELVEQLAA